MEMEGKAARAEISMIGKRRRGEGRAAGDLAAAEEMEPKMLQLLSKFIPCFRERA